MEPKRRLSNIDVLYISLVDKGANMKRIVYKSANLPEDPDIIKDVEILKTDLEKRMVFGIVYSPEEADSQGDIADAKEIEKAAHAFMKYRRLDKIDKNHNQQPEEGYVVESWITRQDDALFKNDAPIGSWAVGIKIENDKTWAEVKKGNVGGLSLMGTASVESLEKRDEETTWDLIKRKLGLSELEKEGRVISGKNVRVIQEAISALNKLLELGVEKQGDVNMTPEEIKELIAKTINESLNAFENKIKENMNKAFDDRMVKVEETIKKNADILEALKKSNGSQQQEGQETSEPEEELAKRGQYKDEKGVVRNHVFA